MGAKLINTLTAVLILLLGSFTCIHAQQTQIPTLQVCNKTIVHGEQVVVEIKSRKDPTHAGTFIATIIVNCYPPDYPSISKFTIKVDMVDSMQGTITGTTIDQMTSTGKPWPAVYLNGRCNFKNSEKIVGARYWLMISDNGKYEKGGTPDIV